MGLDWSRGAGTPPCGHGGSTTGFHVRKEDDWAAGMQEKRQTHVQDVHLCTACTPIEVLSNLTLQVNILLHGKGKVKPPVFDIVCRNSIAGWVVGKHLTRSYTELESFDKADVVIEISLLGCYTKTPTAQ